MATVVSITNPVTGAVEQVDKLDHTAQQIDDAVALSPQLSNPNILDNWYFGNPVNQRGQTEYKVSGYTIDRWKAGGYNQIISLVDSGLTWSTTTGVWLTQPIENYDDLVGKTVTVSAIIDGVLYSATGVVSSSSDVAVITKGNIQLEVTHNEKGVRFVTYSNQGTPEISILAAKLELGSQQTLAHQDADGSWVLNEIPDYGEQLSRCQRYFIRIGVPASGENGAIGFANCATTTLANSHMSTPVTMRTLPTATLKNIVLRKGITDFSVTGCNIFAITGNGIYMNFVSSGLTAGDQMLIRTTTGGYIDFSADL